MVSSEEQQIEQDIAEVSEATVVAGLRDIACSLARHVTALKRQGALRSHVEAALGHVDAALDIYDTGC